MNLNEFFSTPDRGTGDNKKIDTQDLTAKENAERLEDALFWSILDDDYLHKHYFLPLARTIKKQLKTKQPDHTHFLKQWYPMVVAGCNAYYKMHALTGDKDEIFDKPLKIRVCKRIAQQFHDDITKDNYKLGESVAVEPDPKGYEKDLLTTPKNSLVIDTPGDLDWYKIGQHYPSLGSEDPHEYGQDDSDMVIVPPSEQELKKLKQKLDRLKLKYKEIGGGHEHPEIHHLVAEDSAKLDYILVADGKQVYKFRDSGEAEAGVRFMQRKFPQKNFELKHEVCTLQDIGEQQGASNKFFFKELTNKQEVIDYVREALIPEMRACGVPITPNNHFTRLSSSVFEGISKVVDSGKEFLKTFKGLDQRHNMQIKVGATVSILNIRMSQEFVELFGFKTPKTITKIYREPTDNKIVQLEFNNDPADVWPRQPLASVNGQMIMTSALFPTADALEKALTMLYMAKPDNLTISSHITESNQEVAEGLDNECPPATQDITLNLKNRQKAIDEYGYGPLNPDLPNTKFWMKKVDAWNLDSPEEAKQSRCDNCAAFDQRADTLACIAQGIDSDQGEDDPTIEAGDLGYCRFLKFKCAAKRTCDAWVTGGPLTDNKGVVKSSNESRSVRSAKLHFETVDIKIDDVYAYLNERSKVYSDQITSDTYFPGRFINGVRHFVNETSEHVEIKPFIDKLQKLDYDKTIKVGDMFAVLQFDINFASKEIEAFGFVKPKEISDIKIAKNGKIQYITFVDGDKFPRQTPATYEGRPIGIAAYFDSDNAASKALTMLSLSVPDGWELYLNNLSNTTTSAQQQGESVAYTNSAKCVPVSEEIQMHMGNYLELLNSKINSKSRK